MNYEEWWEDFVAEHEEWKYADSAALRRAAFQAGAASRDAEIAELVAALELLSKYIAYNGDDWVQRTALEALAKVRKS